MTEMRLGLITSADLSYGVITVEDQISPSRDYDRLKGLGSVKQFNSLELSTLPYRWREVGKGSLMVLRGYARTQRIEWGREGCVYAGRRMGSQVYVLLMSRPIAEFGDDDAEHPKNVLRLRSSSLQASLQ